MQEAVEAQDASGADVGAVVVAGAGEEGEGALRTRHWPLVPQDLAELTRLRDELRALRVASGVPGRDLAARFDRGPEFISRQENASRESPLVSTVAVWGRMLKVRVEWELDGFWRHSWDDPQMLLLWHLSRPYGADDFLSSWLQDALRVLRLRRGVSVEEMAGLMGVESTSMLDRENRAEDPYVRRLMFQARVLEAPLTFRLFREDEWVWG